MPPMVSSRGAQRSVARPRTSLRPTDQRTGAAAPRHSRANATIAADMTNMAHDVDIVFGDDHCHPMVSWDHMASAKTMKIDRAPPTAMRLRRSASSWSRG